MCVQICTGPIFPKNKAMALNSRFILGGALAAAAAHAWWTQPCEPQKPARKPARKPAHEATWDCCSSCHDRLYDIYRFDDSSFCRQCHEELVSSSSEDSD